MRVLVNEIFGFTADGKHLHKIEASGDSTEDKPDEDSVGGPIVDGSICVESDTGKVFFYNEKTEDWIEQFSFQS